MLFPNASPTKAEFDLLAKRVKALEEILESLAQPAEQPPPPKKKSSK